MKQPKKEENTQKNTSQVLNSKKEARSQKKVEYLHTTERK